MDFPISRLYAKRRNPNHYPIADFAKSVTISIIKKQQYVRHFKVWDLEWVPDTYDLRMCGVYDERGYRDYKTIPEFILHELHPSSSGQWFYAHFGGMADLQFLVQEFLDHPEFSVRGAFSGASCVVAFIRHAKFKWTFVDSFWLLRSKLEDIAKSIGMKKGGPAGQEGWTDAQRKHWYATVPYAELREYNENDCKILYEAIHRAQIELLELGGQMQMTLASTALQLFRRKYLKEDIQTNAMANEVIRKSYFASRVEVFQREVDYPGLYYDVNSSFPFAMTYPLPGRIYGNFDTIPDYAWDNYPFFADCTIETANDSLPVMPYRQKGKVFFPLGRWRNWFSSVDLSLLLATGGSIKRVHEATLYEPFYDLANYANDLYNIRKKETDPFRKDLFKLLMNAAYGKFAEGAEKTTLLLNPNKDQLARLSKSLNMLTPGVYFTISEVPVPHAHVPLSSFITAIARRTLWEFMSQASEIHYCDTDGFSTTTEDIFPASSDLGGLKLEKSFETATFAAPKLYRWYPGNGKAPIVKAKGFSLHKGQGTPTEKFDHLIHGGEVEVERMMRIKEMLNYSVRHGFPFHPRNAVGKGERKLTKGLRQLWDNMRMDRIGKRFMYPDGFTRPWTIEELGGE